MNTKIYKGVHVRAAAYLFAGHPNNLMLCYALLMAFIMLLFNIRKGALGGVVAVFGFSLYGFLLNPQTLQLLLRIPDEMIYKANVAVGWLSPLNQAIYHMHNFGYDLLPTMGQTFLIFAALIALCFCLSLRIVRKYNSSDRLRKGGRRCRFF